MTTTTTRRALLAAVLPTMATMLVVGEALTPTGLDRPITTRATALRELATATAHSGQLFFSNLLVVFGLGALGVAFCAIATLPRDRGTATATAAAAVGVFGAFCGALANVLIGFNLAAAATAHTTIDAAAQVLVSANTSAVATMLFAGYLGGVLMATILTAVALWRGHVVAHWLVGLFAVGLVIAALSPPGIVAVALSVPFIVAIVLLAVQLRTNPHTSAHGDANEPIVPTVAP